MLSTTAEFVYKTTDYYAPKFERTIVWDDPDLAIACPLQEEPIVSPKDQVGKRLKAEEVCDDRNTTQCNEVFTYLNYFMVFD